MKWSIDHEDLTMSLTKYIFLYKSKKSLSVCVSVCLSVCLCMCASNISAHQDQTDLRVSTWLLHTSRVCKVAFVWTTMLPLINYFINAFRSPLALSTIATIVMCAPEPVTAHHSHVCTRANHCRARFHDIP